ncbi:GtrA family protein [Microbacterium paludicola]|uniref:GtrA family protein n=1 Tax=Microbacterium paludicola TaxID=300019 RepID=UPI0031D8760D
MLSFLVIGGVAFLFDFATYNALVFWVTGRGPLFEQPMVAKIIAIAVASVVAYVGNHFWTFQDRSLPHTWSRYTLFMACNLVAIGLQLSCLAFSRYVLGWETLLADNIFGGVIGQTVATVFRYWSYERFVFCERARGV